MPIEYEYSSKYKGLFSLLQKPICVSTQYPHFYNSWIDVDICISMRYLLNNEGRNRNSAEIAQKLSTLRFQ